MVSGDNKKGRIIILIFVAVIAVMLRCDVIYGSEYGEEMDAFVSKYHFTGMHSMDVDYIEIQETEDSDVDMVLSIDISGKNMLAILQEDRNILIYDKDLTLRHVYKLKFEGDYIKWFDDSLFVYGAKSGIAVLFGLDGEIKKVYEEDINYGDQLWQYFLNAEHINGKYKYCLSKKKDRVKKAFFDTTAYPYVLRVNNNNNNIEVIYSAENAYIIREIFLWGIVFLVSLILIISFLFKAVVEKKEQDMFIQGEIAKRNKYIQATGKLYTYAINQNKKEFINTEKTKYVINDSTYRINPSTVLFESSPKGIIRGRWLGDEIVWSNVKPREGYKDISDLLIKYYSDNV